MVEKMLGTGSYGKVALALKKSTGQKVAIKRMENIFEDEAIQRRIRILELRMNGATLDEIGKQFGVSRERIRQIEMKAIRKLKNPELKLAEVFAPEDLYQPTNRRKKT